MATMSVRCSQRTSRGFTLIELVVVTAVILVVLAILLPAVQSARESVRRLHCGNNLRQIGIALHSYHSIHDSFPLLSIGARDAANYNNHWEPWGPGVLVHILSVMDNQPLYNTMNFQVACLTGCEASGRAQNLTIRNTALAMYLCPSDTGSRVYPYGGNYAASVGPQFNWGTTSAASAVGAFANHTSYSIRHFTDGTANTLAFSEARIGSNRPLSRTGIEYYTGLGWPTDGMQGTDSDQQATNPTGIQAFYTYVQKCDHFAATNSAAANDNVSSNWSFCRLGEGMSFSMLLTPNPKHAICTLYPATNGMFATKSRHPGGVNSLFVDGSVHFVKDAINQSTWWSLGTRAGGEVIGSDDL